MNSLSKKMKRFFEQFEISSIKKENLPLIVSVGVIIGLFGSVFIYYYQEKKLANESISNRNNVYGTSAVEILKQSESVNPTTVPKSLKATPQQLPILAAASKLFFAGKKKQAEEYLLKQTQSHFKDEILYYHASRFFLATHSKQGMQYSLAVLVNHKRSNKTLNKELIQSLIVYGRSQHEEKFSDELKALLN